MTSLVHYQLCPTDTQVSSTPLVSLRKGAKNDLLSVHATISPIFYDMIDDKSYTLTKAPSSNPPMERTYDMHNTTVINNATMVKKSSAKRDILAAKPSPEKRLPPSSRMRSPSCGRVPPTGTGQFQFYLHEFKA